MSKGYKVAGQASLAASVDTTIYTVPSEHEFVGSTLACVNRDTGTVAALNVAIVPSGSTLSDEHYIEYGRLIAPRQSIRLTLGMSLSEGDKVILTSDESSVSATLFGVELEHD